MGKSILDIIKRETVGKVLKEVCVPWSNDKLKELDLPQKVIELDLEGMTDGDVRLHMTLANGMPVSCAVDAELELI